jgi:hypothetical protein
VISRFDDRGQFIDQFRPVLGPLGPFQHAPRFISALSDGTLLFQGISNPVGEATDKTRALALVRTDRRGAMLDTLASTAVRTSSYVLRFKDGRGIIGSHPAANPDLAAADPEGRWLAIATLELEDPARFGFTVSWIGLDGGLMAAYFVTTTPLSTEPTKHAWIEDLVSRDRVTRGQAVDAVADVPFPPYQAPAQTMFADADGRAWVSTPHASADSVRWYVVDQFSGVVGSFVLPKRVRLMAARQRSVWGWSPGAYDEPYVLKFTAEW